MYSLNFQKRNQFSTAIVTNLSTTAIRICSLALWGDVGESGNHQVLNASTGSLQFCHPPSLPQEACTSAIHPASVRPVPCHAAVKITQQQAHAPADVGSRSGPVAKNI